MLDLKKAFIIILFCNFVLSINDCEDNYIMSDDEEREKEKEEINKTYPFIVYYFEGASNTSSKNCSKSLLQFQENVSQIILDEVEYIRTGKTIDYDYLIEEMFKYKSVDKGLRKYCKIDQFQLYIINIYYIFKKRGEPQKNLIQNFFQRLLDNAERLSDILHLQRSSLMQDDFQTFSTLLGELLSLISGFYVN